MNSEPHASSTSEIEVIRAQLPRGGYRAAIFDFDGTLSLVRRNWQAVMIPMMVDVLKETGTDETPDALAAHVEDFVMRLNGKQTIYQMIQLAEEVEARGAAPLEPLEYKHRYHDLLWEQVGERVRQLETGEATTEEMTVPRTHEFLTTLADRGIALYLASGTDLKYVRREAELLDVARFFGEHIYGALDDYQNFSKRMIVDRIIEDTGVPGEQLLGFGDGFVEIEEVRRGGGVAIGVASEEETRQGVNAWKRNRLIEAGADVIIPDYREMTRLLDLRGI